MKGFVLFIVLLFIFACEKEANIKLPDTKSQPVVFCYLSPQDTVIRVKLTMSQPLFGEQNIDITDPVADATILLSSSQGNITLTFNPQSGYYQTLSANYPIYFGETYKLSINLSNGGYVEAITKMPDNTVPISNASFQIIKENYTEYKRFKVSFIDDPSTVNFYRISAIKLQVYSWQNDTIRTETFARALYTDEGHNGELLETGFNTYYGDTNNDSTVAHDVLLINCSKDYYLFYKSFNNYQEGNPFAEPSLIYTNIKGGLGVFAAYSRSKYRINI
ncbi:MAG: DUF4249 domain-containing protein [Bacteroidia bacterium]|nr:DUF4249 domain-containing protein [Bacteroidia bacterium]